MADPTNVVRLTRSGAASRQARALASTSRLDAASSAYSLVRAPCVVQAVAKALKQECPERLSALPWLGQRLLEGGLENRNEAQGAGLVPLPTLR